MRRRRALAVALATLASALVASCGGGSNRADVALIIAVPGTPEEEVLGHIYLQALKAAGFEVRGNFGAQTEYLDAPKRELRSGRISGFPAHVDALLKETSAVQAGLPSDSQEAFKLVKDELAGEGLTAFPPTPYALSRPVVVLRKTARRRHLQTISDLKGPAAEMTLLGPTDCHLSTTDCLGGMEHLYHVYFESISYTYTPREIRDRYRYLAEGKYDAVIGNNTEGRLAKEDGRFVALEDDRHLFAAGNALFVTSKNVVEEAGPELEETIVAAQRGLTLPIMQQLDAEVELEGKAPAKVAAAYLAGI